MGLNSFVQTLNRFNNEWKYEVSCSCFQHKRVAIDFQIESYRFLYYAKKKILEEYGMVDDNQIILDRYMLEWREFIDYFKKLEIIPVIIFDGKRYKEKEKTSQVRLDQYLQNKKQYDKEMDPVKKEKRWLNLIRSGGNEKSYIESFFIEWGIETIQAPHDAEQLGSYLVKTGNCDALFTKDADAFAFGCPVVIRRFIMYPQKSLDKRWVGTFEVSTLEEVLETLDVTLEQLVDCFILCGCDYNDGIKGVGLITSLKWIKQYIRIEEIKQVNFESEELDVIGCREKFYCNTFF